VLVAYWVDLAIGLSKPQAGITTLILLPASGHSTMSHAYCPTYVLALAGAVCRCTQTCAPFTKGTVRACTRGPVSARNA
jgi:hypothetical protein